MRVTALLICLLVSFSAFAEDKISGYITGGIFVINSDDKLMVDGDGDKSDFDSLTKIGAMISGEINYALNDRTKIHFGAPRTEIVPKLELGVTSKFMNKTEADVSLLISPIENEWENPYVYDRSKSKAESYGLKIKLKNIGGSGFFAESAAVHRNVADDKAKAAHSSLGRNGYDYELKAGYTLKKGKIFTDFFAKYSRGDRSGSAESFDGFGGGVKVTTLTHDGDFLIFLLSADRVDFDSANPYFEETRKETDYSAMLLYTLNNPFGFKDKFLTFAGGYSAREANTEFFDAETYFAAIGAGLNF
ncbi:DUF2860 family protein [Seleniivibrio woodruffii]|uniref:Uncharacterized protein DUF2860 n=1 Tax=Seleniivibrio woodruffii TaxID=1078050 RepID=A0A4R1KD49_9BACT|nr:DUF2860 family protein [Seleniivibrio woodruffii]TCK62017.1 uncharacterized protein DUF2860 [Seleniivibrio woodruffii]TVZ34866.1 uncharacterized protein DUF2860 [Seleniivibrio woodruffii]